MRSAALAALLLSGCVLRLPPQAGDAPAPPAPTPACPAPVAPPPPVWPDKCVENWYAKAELPACVKDWVVDLTAQQKAIARKRKRK